MKGKNEQTSKIKGKNKLMDFLNELSIDRAAALFPLSNQLSLDIEPHVQYETRAWTYGNHSF
jgi:hypothetical protein